ncbi:MAG: NAD(P)-dependent oxidoreductase [Planctomycetaceae bacterium]|nr:NAD(P)-dependent oxidoreductase [Planctomycetaceae bacterium]
MRIAIVGKNGLLGGALIRHAVSLNLSESSDFAALDLPDFNVTSRRFVLEMLGELKPEVIINTAGVTMIDWLEKKPNTARTIHVQGTANLREAAIRTDALLVQVSCAEVFGQTADLLTVNGLSPFSEGITPEPVSVYAKTKLDGERAARETPHHLVVRTGPLFGKAGGNSSGNLVETLLQSLRRQEKMSVINDQWASYTWADDLARAVFALIERKCTGLYHVANAGMASSFDMAREIVRQTGVKREFGTIVAADYGFVAPRAKYTVLDTAKYDAVEGTPKLSGWQTALDTYLASRNAI